MGIGSQALLEWDNGFEGAFSDGIDLEELGAV
jgi:hypothetical protein